MLSLNDIEFARIVQIKYFHFCNPKSSSMIKCWCCCSQLSDMSSVSQLSQVSRVFSKCPCLFVTFPFLQPFEEQLHG